MTFHTTFFELSAMIILMTAFAIRSNGFKPGSLTDTSRKFALLPNMAFLTWNFVVFSLQWKFRLIMIYSNSIRRVTLLALLLPKLAQVRILVASSTIRGQRLISYYVCSTIFNMTFKARNSCVFGVQWESGPGMIESLEMK
jgi:hypothetical protein